MSRIHCNYILLIISSLNLFCLTAIDVIFYQPVGLNHMYIVHEYIPDIYYRTLLIILNKQLVQYKGVPYDWPISVRLFIRILCKTGSCNVYSNYLKVKLWQLIKCKPSALKRHKQGIRGWWTQISFSILEVQNSFIPFLR